MKIKNILMPLFMILLLVGTVLAETAPVKKTLDKLEDGEVGMAYVEEKTTSGSTIRIWDDGSWEWVTVGLGDLFTRFFTSGRQGIDNIPDTYSRQAYVMVSQSFCSDRGQDYIYCKSSTDCCCDDSKIDAETVCAREGYTTVTPTAPSTSTGITVEDCIDLKESQGRTLYYYSGIAGICQDGLFYAISEANDICSTIKYGDVGVCPSVVTTPTYSGCTNPTVADGGFACENGKIYVCHDGYYNYYTSCSDYSSSGDCTYENAAGTNIASLCEQEYYSPITTNVCCWTPYSLGDVDYLWTAESTCNSNGGMILIGTPESTCNDYASSSSSCGDGTCEVGEDSDTCSADCKSTEAPNVMIDILTYNIPAGAGPGDYIDVYLTLTNKGGATTALNPANVEVALYGGDAKNSLGYASLLGRAYATWQKNTNTCVPSEGEQGFVKSYSLYFSEAGTVDAQTGPYFSSLYGTNFKVQVKIPQLGDKIGSGESNYDAAGKYVIVVNTYNKCWSPDSNSIAWDSEIKSITVSTGPISSTDPIYSADVCCKSIFGGASYKSSCTLFIETIDLTGDACSSFKVLNQDGSINSVSRPQILEATETVKLKVEGTVGEVSCGDDSSGEWNGKSVEVENNIIIVSGISQDKDGANGYTTCIDKATDKQFKIFFTMLPVVLGQDDEIADGSPDGIIDLSPPEEKEPGCEIGSLWDPTISGCVTAEQEETVDKVGNVCCLTTQGTADKFNSLIDTTAATTSTVSAFTKIINFLIPGDAFDIDTTNADELAEKLSGYPDLEVLKDYYTLYPGDCPEITKQVKLDWCTARGLTESNPTTADGTNLGWVEKEKKDPETGLTKKVEFATSYTKSKWDKLTDAQLMLSTCSLDEHCAEYEDYSGSDREYEVSCITTPEIEAKITSAAKNECAGSWFAKLAGGTTAVTGAACGTGILLGVIGTVGTGGAGAALAVPAVAALCTTAAVAGGATIATVSGCAIAGDIAAKKGACIAIPAGTSYGSWEAFLLDYGIEPKWVVYGLIGLLILYLLPRMFPKKRY